MKKQIQITISPEKGFNPESFKEAAAHYLGITVEEIASVVPLKRALDARGGQVRVHLTLDVYTQGTEQEQEIEFIFKDVSKAKRVVVAGMGPAGMFAALRLIELGLKPIVIERGKKVTDRKADVAQLNRTRIINPESNYCFGEGGAGTFSDGKLYTRSQKRGDVLRILRLFHIHGSNSDILFDTHPHIGTDKLPTVVKRIRETILKHGGEIHFDWKLTDIKTENEVFKAVVNQHGDELQGEALILATGHSARDVYYLLRDKKVKLEFKPFSAGVRVEHPQMLIDQIQYHSDQPDPWLPAAAYSLATNIEERGVYSFCMCPGGFIVSSSTDNNEIVVNGMSPSRRDSPFANSGIVVEIREEDLQQYASHGEFAGIALQQDLEHMASLNGGNTQIAPAQRLADFVKGRISQSLPDCSYVPGIEISPVHFWYPDFIAKRIRGAMKMFDKKMHGYLTNEAVVVAAESRTSTPLRIPRNAETLENEQLRMLFPCGEGAGYAGGIVSSAMDGERCAEMVAKKLNI